MILRRKKILLLSSVLIMLALMILDIWINRDEGFETFGKQFFNEQKTREFRLAHPDVNKTMERQMEVERGSIQEVFLSNTRGDISVSRATGSTIHIKATVTVNGADADKADRKLEAIQVQQTVDNGRLTIQATIE